tara:strand:+ start:1631 stop:3619 length:1989 start_codon:yes stop_codon:yes gene_type:complete
MSNKVIKFSVISVSLILIVLLPFLISQNENDLDPVPINDESIGYYQTNTCKISLIDVVVTNSNKNIEYKLNNYSGIDCYGKVTGLDKVGTKYIVYFGMNNLINFIHQSLIWFCLLSLFFGTKKKEIFRLDTFSLLIIPALYMFHFFGEESFYIAVGSNFNSDLNFENYFMLSLFVGLILLTISLENLLRSNLSDLIYFVPFLFLINGTFFGMNLNFFLILFSILGIKNLKKLKYYNLIYIGFASLWLLNHIEKSIFFDVDKLRGFVNSSNTTYSLLFWIIAFYLLINGLIYTYFQIDKKINFDRLINNFLISGSLIVFFGLLGTINSFLNTFIFYIFGLNKNGSTTIESVVGNAWRGLSPSAELIGEYFAFAILIYALNKISTKQKIKNTEALLLIVNIFGLFRSNNRAAFILLTLILLFFYYRDLILERKYIFILLIIILCFCYFFFFFDYDYNSGSQMILAESMRNSNIDIEWDNYNQAEKFLVEQDYKTLVKTGNNKEKLSNTQLKIIDSFTSDRKIPFLPHAISILSIISLIINRSEKWGIFFAKYNPDLSDFIFGYGPQQLSEYHNGHQIKSSLSGLIIPHSSFLLLLIFFGLSGVIFLIFLLIRKLKKSYNHLNYSNYLLIFIIINYLKSDSILYLSGFVLLSLVLSINKDSFGYE